MKAYEILSIAQPIIDKLVTAGINPKDIRYLELYHEYKRLKEEGHKITWIVSFLSEQYDVSEANVYNVVKRLDSDL